MPKITVLAKKTVDLHLTHNFSYFLAGQLDLQSKKRSKSNFDCRNEFLVVDYIGLDTSYDKIEDFTQNVRGGRPPRAGV